MLKKNKIIVKKKDNRIINFLGILVIISVFSLGIFTINFAKEFDFLVLNEVVKDNGTITKDYEKKDKINILLLGRGGIKNDAPDLTDSIILASINKNTKIISMFSIPRDLYVKYYNGDKGKINKAYASFKSKSGEIDFGIDALKYNIELLTSQKIDYYLNIDFEGFIKFIDSIGGVKVTLEENFVDNKFPDNNWGYRTFIIKKGTWNLDGETALNYARSRHSTSDFDRSLRQQNIIKSVKNKLSEGGFFGKVSKIKDFYHIFSKYVHTDIGLNDSLEIFNEIKNNNYTIISSNLNDSCFQGDPSCQKGGFLYIPERQIFGGASVLLVNGTHINKLNDYSNIKKYLEIVFEKNNIYKENINISVLNSTKKPLLAGDLAFLLRKYGFNIPHSKYSISNTREKIFEKSIIQYNRNIENSETIKFLKENMGSFEFIAKDDIEYSLNENSLIEIIIGEDYRSSLIEVNSNFN